MAIISKSKLAIRQARRQPARSSLNFYRQSTVSNKKPAKSATTAAKAKSFAAWLGSRVTIIILGLAFIFFGISSSTHPKVVVGSTAYHPLSDYQALVQKSINVLKDSTKITFDSQTIVNVVEANFPEVSAATVELPLVGRTPVVRLDISPPQFKMLDSTGRQLVITSQGRLASLPTYAGAKALIMIKDLSGAPLEDGDQVFSPNQIDNLNKVEAQLQAAKIIVSYVSLPRAAQEADFHLKGLPYFIKINLTKDGAGQVGAYLAIKNYLRVHHVHPQDYVDVRISGKVFYK